MSHKVHLDDTPLFRLEEKHHLWFGGCGYVVKAMKPEGIVPLK